MFSKYTIVNKINPTTAAVVFHFQCKAHVEDASRFSTITCHLGSGDGKLQDVQFYYGVEQQEIADDLVQVERNTSAGQWSAILYTSPSYACTVSKAKVIFEQIN